MCRALSAGGIREDKAVDQPGRVYVMTRGQSGKMRHPLPTSDECAGKPFEMSLYGGEEGHN